MMMTVMTAGWQCGNFVRQDSQPADEEDMIVRPDCCLFVGLLLMLLMLLVMMLILFVVLVAFFLRESNL
jgi:hypothetical protein